MHGYHDDGMGSIFAAIGSGLKFAATKALPVLKGVVAAAGGTSGLISTAVSLASQAAQNKLAQAQAKLQKAQQDAANQAAAAQAAAKQAEITRVNQQAAAVQKAAADAAARQKAAAAAAKVAADKAAAAQKAATATAAAAAKKAADERAKIAAAAKATIANGVAKGVLPAKPTPKQAATAAAREVVQKAGVNPDSPQGREAVDNMVREAGASDNTALYIGAGVAAVAAFALLSRRRG